MDIYKKKYLKYKKKYLNLLNQQGGIDEQITNLLETKTDLLNSLLPSHQEKIKKINTFDHVSKILSLSKDEINMFFVTYNEGQQQVLLKLTQQQIKDFMTPNKQITTLNKYTILSISDIDDINYFLSQKIDLQKKLLTYKIIYIKFLINIGRSQSNKLLNELVQLTQNEIRLFKLTFSEEDISKFANLSLKAPKINQLIKLSIAKPSELGSLLNDIKQKDKILSLNAIDQKLKLLK
jgi:hypothetical protein